MNATWVEDFRAAIAARLGLALGNEVQPRLSALVKSHAARLGETPSGYVDWLRRSGSADDDRLLAEELTVGESYFLRGPEQLIACCEQAIPERAGASSTGRVRVLSAGCSSGEEPYSLAMLLRDRSPALAPRVDLFGVDMNPAAITKARDGRYTSWSMRGTPPSVIERHFRSDGGTYWIAPTLREAVRFEVRNLLDEHASFWQRDALDVILCRNVFMYLAPAALERLVANLERGLAPGGYLFLGAADSLRGFQTALRLEAQGDVYFYRKPAPARPTLTERPPSERLLDERPHAGGSVTSTLPAPEAREPSTPTPGRARDRADRSVTRPAPITRVASPAPDTAEAAPPSLEVTRSRPRRSLQASPEGPVGGVLRAIEAERFDEALARLDAIPDPAPIEAELVRGALFTIVGRLDEAEQACARVLAVDYLEPAAHHLMALCRQHAGDLESARRHYEIALYLDAGFAMPRYQLGLLARRAGDTDRAERELLRALALFAHEEPLRILLFGGGFDRQALVELCRVEIRACGGRGAGA